MKWQWEQVKYLVILKNMFSLRTKIEKMVINNHKPWNIKVFPEVKLTFGKRLHDVPIVKAYSPEKSTTNECVVARTVFTNRNTCWNSFIDLNIRFSMKFVVGETKFISEIVSSLVPDILGIRALCSPDWLFS